MHTGTKDQHVARWPQLCNTVKGQSWSIYACRYQIRVRKRASTREYPHLSAWAKATLALRQGRGRKSGTSGNLNSNLLAILPLFPIPQMAKKARVMSIKITPLFHHYIRSELNPNKLVSVVDSRLEPCISGTSLCRNSQSNRQ